MRWIPLLLLGSVLGHARTAQGQSVTCADLSAAARGWPEAQSPRLPGVRLQVPPGFVRNPAESMYVGPPAPAGSLWTGPAYSQLAIAIKRTAESPLFVSWPEPSDSLPEYRRCELVVGGIPLTLVMFNKRQDVGDMAYIGPFLVRAEWRPAGGPILQAVASTQSRERWHDLVAAILTLTLGGS